MSARAIGGGVKPFWTSGANTARERIVIMRVVHLRSSGEVQYDVWVSSRSIFCIAMCRLPSMCDKWINRSIVYEKIKREIESQLWKKWFQIWNDQTKKQPRSLVWIRLFHFVHHCISKVHITAFLKVHRATYFDLISLWDPSQFPSAFFVWPHWHFAIVHTSFRYKKIRHHRFEYAK